jgi:hypothetical protein
MFKRTRKLIALIGLAVAIGAPLTPARALVPTAWPRGHDESGLVIKTDWAKEKRDRLARADSNYCYGNKTHASCDASGIERGGYTQVVCKWQKGTILHSGEGYCYGAGKGGHR